MKDAVKYSELSITNLLAILYAAHTTRRSTLDPHRIPLRAWRAIALPWVGTSLLGPGSCGRPLLLLGVGTGTSIWLTTHLSYLVHWARRLEDKNREIVNETQ